MFEKFFDVFLHHQSREKAMSLFIKILTTGVLAVFTSLSVLGSNLGNGSAEKDGYVALKPISTISATSTSESFICEWAWPEHTLDVIDSHLPFIFRTKKAAELDELKIVVNINSKGKIIGFDLMTENVDKGTKERVAHVLRKLPNAQPVPGFTSYSDTSFELLISY
ncbi:hypothetical protein [Mongoliitalea daihaiensis]|uniref:hypothetical protein n=1 Tax=Mongoliitalea daihaiensis TaxID=2782006 RepID=UPI001F1FB6A9|nr:hypothetical protein [Mongoliitalea daihaiensis]UJP63477.1 hypothetical protein IPZ59_11540 [Mongoliitalea daihaiensis]